jgi:hypothetical protein
MPTKLQGMQEKIALLTLRSVAKNHLILYMEYSYAGLFVANTRTVCRDF